MTTAGTPPELHKSDGGKTAAELERDIGRTRAELGLTLEALEDKLEARHLVEKGIEMLKDTFANSENLGRGVDLVRANPIPVALIGVGAAWLIANSTGLAEGVARDERVRAAGRRVAGMASDLGTKAGTMASDVASRVGLGSSGPPAIGHTGNAVVDNAADGRTDGWVHQATGAAQGALRTVRDTSSDAIDSAGEYAGYVGDGARRISDRVVDAFDRHPLLLGAVGAVAGALLGTLLPATHLEDSWVGETRDDLWRKAEEAGQDAVAHVRGVAERSVGAAADAAFQVAKDEADRLLPKQADNAGVGISTSGFKANT